MLTYLIVIFSSLILSSLFTFLAIKVAFKLGIVDNPGLERKIHKTSTPLLGGVAVFFAFVILALIYKNNLLAGDLESHHLLGVLMGSTFLMIGGVLDDKYDLGPGKQFIFPILAVLAVIVGGVGIEKITNPFGGLTYLDQLRIPIADFGGGMHYFMVIADTFTILWLLGMMYTTKLLDGMDGLVTGVTAIGAFIIFLFTMTTKYYQPDIGIAALILAGACLGFLVFNWHPAKIFLGESGSLFLGFILGVLAIISGGKIAIALLVMGIPILDVAWTIIRRLAAGKNPLKFADRKHLHFRLFDLGLGVRKTVLVFYLFSIIFGLSALFLQSRGKLLTLGGLVIIMLGMVIGIEKKIKM